MSIFKNKNTKYISYKQNNKPNTTIELKHKEKLD
jgi:hypothetical protein